jgi:hypothetical protein
MYDNVGKMRRETKTDKHWEVRWKDNTGESLVSSPISAKHAIDQAKKYFGDYSPKTRYTLTEVTVTKRIVGKFTSKTCENLRV